MRLIDADRTKAVMERTLEDLKLFFQLREQRAHLISAFYTVGDIVDNALTIDAVPVVRCKDCKHRDHYECNNIMLGKTRCGVTDDWFCADGERKDNETD